MNGSHFALIGTTEEPTLVSSFSSGFPVSLHFDLSLVDDTYVNPDFPT